MCTHVEAVLAFVYINDAYAKLCEIRDLPT